MMLGAICFSARKFIGQPPLVGSVDAERQPFYREHLHRLARLDRPHIRDGAPILAATRTVPRSARSEVDDAFLPEQRLAAALAPETPCCSTAAQRREVAPHRKRAERDEPGADIP